MSSYRLSHRAANDIYEIVLRVATENRTAARKLRLGLYETFRYLGRSPSSGMLREDLAPGIRIFSHRNYVVCFRAVPNGVDILRVLHAARQWESERLS